jgi:hypothetical protein
MKIRYRFGLSLGVTAVLLVTGAVIFTRGFGIEIRASADTAPLMPDDAEANKGKGGALSQPRATYWSREGWAVAEPE